MRMTKPIVTMAATLAACISTAEAAVGSSDWFFVDTTEKHQDYVLKFDANLGTGTIEDMPLSYGEQISLPDPKNKITRDGYAFVGWSTNLNVNIFNHLDIDKMEFDYDAMGVYRPGDTWCLDEESILPESVTLYAIWIEDVTIHFNINGGDGTVNSIKVSFGESVSLPVPGRRGENIFLGWARSPTADLQIAVRTGKGLSEVEGFYPMNSPPRKFLGYVVTYDQPSSEQKNYHYEPGLTLFAIWTTTLTYSFYNEKLYDPTLGYSIPRLNPQELADHLHWSYHSGLDEDNADWVWSRCAHGKSAEVYPGSHVIKLESDPGYEWLAELSKTVDMDSDGEVWSVTESSV